MPIEDDLAEIQLRLRHTSHDGLRYTPSCGTKICRGWHLIPSSADNDRSPWQIRHLIHLAAVTATAKARPTPPVFTRETALLLHGIPTLYPHRTISLRSPTPTKMRSLPPVVHQGVRCEQRLRQVWSAQRLPPIEVAGLLVDSLPETAVEIALTAPEEEAAIAVSGILRRLSAFDRFDLVGSRAREASARATMQRLLDTCGPTNGSRRALQILQSADAGCENPAEAKLHHLLLQLFPEPLVTQCEQWVGRNRYFIDMALPDRRLAFEFDGMAKLGTTTAEFERAKREMWDRQRDLQDAGWQVVRVRWDEFSDTNRLVGRILRAAGR